MESIYRQYYDEPRFRPSPLTGQRVAAGLFGRKSGSGFYRHENGRQEEIPDPPAPAARPASVWVSRSGLGAKLADWSRSSARASTRAPSPRLSRCISSRPVGRDATATALDEGLDPTRTLAVDCLFALDKRRTLMTTSVTRPRCAPRARPPRERRGAGLGDPRFARGSSRSASSRRSSTSPATSRSSASLRPPTSTRR